MFLSYKKSYPERGSFSCILLFKAELSLLSFARMVGVFGVFLHIFFVEKHVLELSLRVHVALIEEMAGGRITAFATRQQRPGFNFIAKFHSTNEAIAVETVAFLGTRKIA